MDIEYTLVRELQPYPNNARTHSKKQIRQIANSIKRFGFNNPVIVDERKQVMAGHGRVEAAKLLGLHAPPTIKLSHMSEEEKKAYILADNKLAMKSSWDRETLAIELQGLVDQGFDIELTGFETPEVEVILDEAREANGPDAGPEDASPEYDASATVTVAGDLWILGSHRLLCGDAREQSSYEALLEGSPAEFVFTDPPYNVKIDGHVCGLGRIRHKNFAMGCGEMNEEQFISFLEAVFRRLSLNSKDGSIHQICMDWRHQWEMLSVGMELVTYPRVADPSTLQREIWTAVPSPLWRVPSQF